MASIGSDSGATNARQWVDERDAFISWLRGEFAAANAIIDALCQHLQLLGSPSEYDPVLAAIQQRRFNWNPVLHMQQYYSIAEVLFSLQQVAYNKNLFVGGADHEKKLDSSSRRIDWEHQAEELVMVPEESRGEQVVANGSTTKHVAAAAGLEVGHPNPHSTNKVLDAFEEVDGQQINVLEGLEVHENLFDAQEASRIAALAGESHASKKKNKSGGENHRSSKVKAKEVIHFGTIPSEIVQASNEKTEQPAPELTEERAEPMPAFLESIIDRLVTSRVVPASKRPDSCSISVLEPGDYMPPHKHTTFEQPLFILSLGSQSELTFGRSLKTKTTSTSTTSTTRGDEKEDEKSSPKYKVVLLVGSVLVLQGNSTQLVQCSVSPSPSTRTLITFGKMVKKLVKSSGSPRAAPVSPVSPTGSSTSSMNGGSQSFVPGRLQSSPPAPILVPVPAQVPMIVASIGPYTPVTMVGPGWSTTPPPGITRVPSPGTGVFFPAKGSNSHNPHHHHHMNGSHRRLAAAAAAAGVHHNGGHHFENATAASNGHVMAAGKEVAA